MVENHWLFYTLTLPKLLLILGKMIFENLHLGKNLAIGIFFENWEVVCG